MKKYLLILGILSMNVLASPLDNLSVYGGLGLGGEATLKTDGNSDSADADGMNINGGVRYLFKINDTVSVGPFVDYMSETKFEGGIKGSALSYGVSGKYQDKSGVYGILSLGLNSVDTNVGEVLAENSELLLNYLGYSGSVSSKVKNGATIMATVGYMVNENIAVEAGYRNISFNVDSIVQVDGLGDSKLKEDLNYSTFTLGGAYHF
ncbi:MAG: outer membrane beta-barrel protein [Candidatus Margulisbacteria bacterium]|nr:outer membrane beta-barrel protein [Candidatus Margulisiibacteriota bacterium]